MASPYFPTCKACLCFGISSLAGGGLASAAVSYPTAGGAYTQNFNTLSATGTANSWANDSTLQGWYATQTSGATSTDYTAYQAASGSANQGNLLSLGTSGSSSDRALGGQNGNTTAPTVTTMYYGLQLANATGNTLGTFSLSYAGEQWRVVQNESRDKMVLEYQIFAAGTGSLLAASGWTGTSLGFDAPIISEDPSTNLNGNSTANRVTVSGNVSGFAWADGEELWLRWSDASSGASAGTGATRSMLGIDDLSFSADVIPEPSGFLLSGLGLGLLAVRRRVR